MFPLVKACLGLLLLAAWDQETKPPWRTDLAAARAEAVKSGSPCVVILNIDSHAL